MLTHARRWWADLRSGFWFVPLLLLIAHVGAAILLTSTDMAMNKPWMAHWPNLFGAGAHGARGMLSTIAGSMMTVVGVTLSMTLVTLALASSQYTSRILRNFVGDRITQFVLGMFAGVYCYCLIVLRTIRGGDEGGFVPGLAVLLAVIMAVAGITILIYFIHHIATSIQASNILASVADETISTVDRMYPTEGVAEPRDRAVARHDLETGWSPVMAGRDGYVDRIDLHALHKLAETHGTMVRLERGLGDFVVMGTPLFAVPKGTGENEQLVKALMLAVDLGRYRSLDQNVGYGIRQLVDIALRALSPGINDTTTAVMCIDYLTSILARLATRQIAEREDLLGRSALVINMRRPSFAGLLGIAFDQIRESGRANFAVLQRLLEAVGTIADLPIGLARQQILLDHVALLNQTVESVQSGQERDRLRSMVQHVRSRLTRQELVSP